MKEEGVLALWKGNWAAEYLYVAYGAVQFVAFDSLNKVIDNSFISGSLTGIIASSLTFPFDTLRTRFAVQGNQQTYKSLVQSIRQIHSAEGIAGFYKGLFPTLLQISPYMGIVFTVHRKVKHMLSESSYSSHFDDLIAGSVAGMVGKTAVLPLDVIRKRLQV